MNPSNGASAPKYESSIGLSAIDTVIQDCQQAFAHHFLHPHTHSEERIQTFYAVNGGSFSDDARQHFFARIGNQLGACSRLLDGPSLLALERWAVVTRADEIQSVLIGLLGEIGYNISISNFAMPFFNGFLRSSDSPLPTDRLCTESSAAFVARPPLPNLPFLKSVIAYWHCARRVNHNLDLASAINSVDNRVKLVTLAHESLLKLTELTDPLRQHIRQSIETMGPLSPL